jgi:hypothetical protein
VLENDAQYPSLRDKAARVGMSHARVNTLLQRHLSGEPLISYPRPPKQGPSIARRFLKGAKMLLEKRPKMTASELARGIHNRWKVPMSRMTAWRIITGGLGKRFRRRQRAPLKGKPEVRLAFAKRLRKLISDENPVFLWTDETYAQTIDHQQGMYVDEDEDPEPKGRERWIPKLHTWGCLYEGGFQTWALPEGDGARGGLTGDQYVEIMRKTHSFDREGGQEVRW